MGARIFIFEEAVDGNIFVCFEADKVEYEDGRRAERSTYIRGKGG